MSSSTPRQVVGGVLLSAALVACAASPTTQPEASDRTPRAGAATGMAPVGDIEPVATGLQAPWSVVFLEDTALLSERDSARILELGADGRPREVGVVDGVTSGGEGGLLGLAIDDARRLYVYSTGADGNRIERYRVDGEPGALALGEPVTLVDGLPAASHHDGGRIALGPDGMLYATVGDAGRAGIAQDVESLGGKILRMTPEGRVPDDNPFPDSLVYSYGHRNPQGLAWSDDGTMYATEFGQNTWDELNVITAGGNYGWPVVEGVVEDAEFENPVQQWAPDEASPSGMTHVDGTLFIANLRGQVLRAVPVAAPDTSSDYYAGDLGRLRDVTVAPDGRLWVVTSNTDGRGEPRATDDRILAVEIEQR